MNGRVLVFSNPSKECVDEDIPDQIPFLHGSILKHVYINGSEIFEDAGIVAVSVDMAQACLVKAMFRVVLYVR